jgi:hypothetical protein
MRVVEWELHTWILSPPHPTSCAGLAPLTQFSRLVHVGKASRRSHLSALLQKRESSPLNVAIFDGPPGAQTLKDSGQEPDRSPLDFQRR